MIVLLRVRIPTPNNAFKSAKMAKRQRQARSARRAKHQYRVRGVARQPYIVIVGARRYHRQTDTERHRYGTAVQAVQCSAVQCSAVLT